MRATLGLKVRDVNFAAELLTAEAVDVVRPRSETIFIDAEILARADRAGLRIVETPLEYRLRKAGTSTTSSPGQIWLLLREMWSTVPRSAVPGRLVPAPAAPGDLAFRERTGTLLAMAWGRRTGGSRIAAAAMLSAALLLASCGLVGGSEGAADTDWTVAPQPAPTTTAPTTTTSTPGVGRRASSVQLSEEDRRVIALCQSVSEVQASGMAFWESYNSDSGGLSAAATRMRTALSMLADAADEQVRAKVNLVLAALGRVTGAPDLPSARQAAAEVVQGVGADITAILTELQPVCPGQLKPEDLDQAERVDLATPPPTD